VCTKLVPEATFLGSGHFLMAIDIRLPPMAARKKDKSRLVNQRVVRTNVVTFCALLQAG